MTVALGLCLAVFSVITACSSTPKTQDTAKKALSGTDEQIFLGDGIKKNYDPNVIMKRGEAFFEKEEYAEAIVEYNHFLDLHRTHVLASYAVFRIGESQMKLAKGIQRDPSPIQKALEAFERVRKDFPGSRYDGPALQKIQECHDLLAQTHLFVGQFYYRRGSYLAAAHRFEQIMKLYPDKSVAPDALYFLALSYHDLGRTIGPVKTDAAGREISGQCAFQRRQRACLQRSAGAQPPTLLAQNVEPARPAYSADCTPAGQSTESCGRTDSLCPSCIVPPPFRYGIEPVFCQLPPGRLVLT